MNAQMGKRRAVMIVLVVVCLISTAGATDEGLSNAEKVKLNDTGTTAWMLTSTALVLLMVPGLAMFYAGLVRTKNVVGTMMHSFAAMAVVGVVWMIFGYAMSFGTSYGWCGWNWDYFFLQDIDESMVPAGSAGAI